MEHCFSAICEEILNEGVYSIFIKEGDVNAWQKECFLQMLVFEGNERTIVGFIVLGTFIFICSHFTKKKVKYAGPCEEFNAVVITKQKGNEPPFLSVNYDIIK